MLPCVRALQPVRLTLRVLRQIGQSPAGFGFPMEPGRFIGHVRRAISRGQSTSRIRNCSIATLSAVRSFGAKTCPRSRAGDDLILTISQRASFGVGRRAAEFLRKPESLVRGPNSDAASQRLVVFGFVAGCNHLINKSATCERRKCPTHRRHLQVRRTDDPQGQ
jgi:hypothetical protein